MRYQLRVPIEAMQWVGDNEHEIQEWNGHQRGWRYHGVELQIDAPDGALIAYPGDWIVRANEGEYIVKNEAFSLMYEPVTESKPGEPPRGTPENPHFVTGLSVVPAYHDPGCDFLDIDPAIGRATKPCNCVPASPNPPEKDAKPVEPPTRCYFGEDCMGCPACGRVPFGSPVDPALVRKADLVDIAREILTTPPPAAFPQPVFTEPTHGATAYPPQCACPRCAPEGPAKEKP